LRVPNSYTPIYLQRPANTEVQRKETAATGRVADTHEDSETHAGTSKGTHRYRYMQTHSRRSAHVVTETQSQKHTDTHTTAQTHRHTDIYTQREMPTYTDTFSGTPGHRGISSTGNAHISRHILRYTRAQRHILHGFRFSGSPSPQSPDWPSGPLHLLSNC
jgi:hypothetical protein